MTPFAPIPSAKALLRRFGCAACALLLSLALAVLLSLWPWRTLE